MDTLSTKNYFSISGSYSNSGADMVRIIDITRQMAAENPNIEHSTYIVSFRTRSVMQVKAKEGKVNVFDKGTYKASKGKIR